MQGLHYVIKALQIGPKPSKPTQFKMQQLSMDLNFYFGFTKWSKGTC